MGWEYQRKRRRIGLEEKEERKRGEEYSIIYNMYNSIRYKI